MDSSVQIMHQNFSRLFEDVIRRQGGICLSTTNFSIFSTAHRGIYSYLVTDIQMMKRDLQHEASAMMFYRTKEMWEKVLIYFTLCALEKQCIAPTNQLNCSLSNYSPEIWAKCHRFDQTAINILLHNYFNSSRYFSDSKVLIVRCGGHPPVLVKTNHDIKPPCLSITPDRLKSTSRHALSKLNRTKNK